MCEGPIGLVAIGFLDHRGPSDMPECCSWQSRKLVQFQCCLQCEAVGAGLQLDRGWTDLVSHAKAAAVAAEPVGRPLCRRREIEFVIVCPGRRADECFEAGMLPQ